MQLTQFKATDSRGNILDIFNSLPNGFDDESIRRIGTAHMHGNLKRKGVFSRLAKITIEKVRGKKCHESTR